MIKIIATISTNYKICNELGEIPWIIEADLDRLSSLTRNDVVLMGRKTFESLGELPLPERDIAVITRRTKNKRLKGVKYFKNPNEAINFYKKRDIWVIGGENIFADTFYQADELHITTVFDEISIGKNFPKIARRIWGTGNVISMGTNNLGIGYIQVKHTKV